MIKSILYTFILLISSYALAGDLWNGSPGYIVKSEKKSSDIPAGKCVIVGTIFCDDKPVSGVEVATLNRAVKDFTDEKGTYRIIIDAGDTAIFAYKDGVGEEVIWNYEFKSQYVVEIDFNFTSEKIPVVTYKPVIYLYADDSIKANVKINPLSKLTFTYPESEGDWTVQVNEKSGISIDGNDYPYIFWEGNNHDYQYLMSNQQIEGSIIHQSKLVGFLEESLSAMGLNTKESTDFITFWAPKLIENEYTLIQFLEDAEYETYVSQMEIDPKPLSMKRVYMLCSPLNSFTIPYSIKPQKLESFERIGFTVVEWGGSIIDIETIHP